jgi:hypothetical protein
VLVDEQYERSPQVRCRGFGRAAAADGVVAGGVAEMPGAGPAGSWAAEALGAIAGGAVGLVVIRVKGRG